MILTNLLSLSKEGYFSFSLLFFELLTKQLNKQKSEGERTNPDVSRLNMTSAAAHIT